MTECKGSAKAARPQPVGHGGEYRYANYEADFSRRLAVATLGFRF
jgi:hypothetical protein